MQSERGLRIAVFTHDTFGLGHVRRCLHVVRALAREEPDAALLLITGSPALGRVAELPRHADCVKLPTVCRTGSEASRPPHLPLPKRELTLLRRRLVEQVLRTFEPDVFLVDNFPLGSGRELLRPLEALRGRPTRAVLGLRDIVDEPETVREHWARDGVHAVLERCYDRILVYGMPEVLDVARAYQLAPGVAARVRYCGYLTGAAPPAAARLAELRLPPPSVVASAGGGGDGFPLLRTFLEALERLPEVSALVVTGPLMGAAERAELRARAERSGRAVVRELVPDLPSHMAAADLVVAMGGYNTVAEILALGRPAVLVPRTWRYGDHARGAEAGADGEQLLRARALEKAGAAEMLHPQALSAEALAERMARALRRGGRSASAPFDLAGLPRVTHELLRLAREAREEARRAGA